MPVADSTIPRATYRLQLHAGFTFDDAARIVPYLRRLGISHVYLSPILKARAGSSHGYDVVDHGELNPELGGAEGFERLTQVLHEHGMGTVVDIVPNHLGVMGDDNPWWLDVLENGPMARAAAWFDIDWRPNRIALRDRLLVPVLGHPYGTALEQGEIRLAFDASRAEFSLCYHDHRFPVDPREYPRIFADAARPPVDEITHGDFESLMNAFARLPARQERSIEAQTERYRDKEAHKRRLQRLIEREPAMLAHIKSVLARINGTPGDPRSFDALDALHETQAYRLAFWRVAQDEINYRRFFDVNSLAAVRMDEPEVFERTHQRVLELLAAGAIQGLRIDHSDGLFDPREYFERLQAAVKATGRDCYVVTEKILAVGERLRDDWPVDGTTGYDFGAQLTAWLVDSSSEKAMTLAWQEFTGDSRSFEDIAYHSRRLIMRIALAPEVEALATQLDRIAREDRHTADYTRAALRDAIIEVIACFPVYRTYVSANGATQEDKELIDRAIAGAKRRNLLATERSVLEFLRQALLAQGDREVSPSVREALCSFAMKFQQVTAPVTAKGVEDTALYRFYRLSCLNEVGCDPRRFGISSKALHQEVAVRAARWPHAMLGTSTHDTKRSEDVRARIAVLSEMPDEWRRLMRRWQRLNRSLRRELEDTTAPDAADEYLLYQTLIGTWQADDPAHSLLERLQAYAVKAAREAKRVTSWVNPDEAYEQALKDFIAKLLARPGRKAFLNDLARIGALVEYFGRWNCLGQVVLKFTLPGVPDVYQGCESECLTLVDPDNRRPVDFDALVHRLDQVEHDDRADRKLWLTHRLLALRSRHPGLFRDGDYRPLTVEGPLADHVVAFARSHADQRLVVVAARWFFRLMHGQMQPPVGECWRGTQVHLDSDGTGLVDVLTGGRSVQEERIDLADLLHEWPFAVLHSPGTG